MFATFSLASSSCCGVSVLVEGEQAARQIVSSLLLPAARGRDGVARDALSRARPPTLRPQRGEKAARTPRETLVPGDRASLHLDSDILATHPQWSSKHRGRGALVLVSRRTGAYRFAPVGHTVPALRAGLLAHGPQDYEPPVPLNATDCVPALSAAMTRSDACAGPLWVGSKNTLMVHCAPTATVSPQPLFRVKGSAPVLTSPTDLITRGTAPVLVSVTLCAALRLLSFCVGNTRLLGANV